MRLHYVIAAWGGPRRSDDPRAQADRTWFLRRHIAALTHVRHSLIERVSVVVPEYEDESPEFVRYLEHLDLTGCHVVRRNNAGFSYGSWTETYERTRTAFDGFIFVEDDYIFVVDDFDRILVDEAARRRAGLVCGAVLPFQTDRGTVMHPGIAIGYCPTAALDQWAARRKLPHQMRLPPTARSSDYGGYQNAEFWQVTWGGDFAALQLPMVDWLDTYASPFWSHTSEVRWYGDRAAWPLIMPLQVLGHTVPRRSPDDSWHDMYSFAWPRE